MTSIRHTFLLIGLMGIVGTLAMLVRAQEHSEANEGRVSECDYP